MALYKIPDTDVSQFDARHLACLESAVQHLYKSDPCWSACLNPHAPGGAMPSTTYVCFAVTRAGYQHGRAASLEVEKAIQDSLGGFGAWDSYEGANRTPEERLIPVDPDRLQAARHMWLQKMISDTKTNLNPGVSHE